MSEATFILETGVTPMQTADLSVLAQELSQTHHCHTVILYGSRAHDTYTDASDIDVVCFGSQVVEVSDARFWQGYWLDAWIYPETKALDTEQFLHLHQGQVLCQKDDFGTRLLAEVAHILDTPPPPTPPDVWQHRRVWLSKTLARIERGDPEAWYRRHWLIADLLEVHMTLQHQRFLGFKRTMQWLADNDPHTHALFVALYSREPDFEQLTSICQHILQISADRHSPQRPVGFLAPPIPNLIECLRLSESEMSDWE
jgi:hypothetical protein